MREPLAELRRRSGKCNVPAAVERRGDFLQRHRAREPFVVERRRAQLVAFELDRVVAVDRLKRNDDASSAQRSDGRRGDQPHVSSAPRVSGIQIHAAAATKKTAPVTMKAGPKPCEAASEPTVYGAAALAIR